MMVKAWRPEGLFGNQLTLPLLSLAVWEVSSMLEGVADFSRLTLHLRRTFAVRRRGVKTNKRITTTTTTTTTTTFCLFVVPTSFDPKKKPPNKQQKRTIQRFHSKVVKMRRDREYWQEMKTLLVLLVLLSDASSKESCTMAPFYLQSMAFDFFATTWNFFCFVFWRFGAPLLVLVLVVLYSIRNVQFGALRKGMVVV